MMQRSSLVGGGILVIVVGGIAWYAANHPFGKTPGAPAAFTLPAQSPYVEHTAYYDIFVNYATSTPLAGSANNSALALMKSYLSETVAEFKSGSNPDRGRKETLQITYLIASSVRTVSYIFTLYEDTLGAHGNTFFHTFTFDTFTGAPLSLADLFLPGAPYLGALSTSARAKLPAVIGGDADTDFIKNGTMPEDKNFSNFFFDNRDFVILFAPYQVAAYTDGPQTLRIPLAEFSRILKPEYR